MHTFYADFEATFDIASGAIIAGRFPQRASALTREWIVARNEELLHDWALAEQSFPLLNVTPLD